MPETATPEAVVYVATGCPHCPAVIDGLVRLAKSARLARLEVINLSADPEAARRSGIRSVPTTRIGPFTLSGAMTPAELGEWVDAVADGRGWSAYYAHLLENHRLDEVVERVRGQAGCLGELLGLLSHQDTSMAARIGISAVVEDLQGSATLRAVVPELEQLTLSDLPQTRADACHFLGLTGDAGAIPAVRRLLDDEQADVREIAVDTLALLGDETAGREGP
jgi:hypothetical protein